MSVYTMQDDELIDNAACAAQSNSFNEDPVLKEAVQLNCIAPLRKRITELETGNGFNSGYEAGRESVIANRDTFQKVKAEGIRQGIKEGMERAAVLVGQAHHTAGNVFESLAIRIRKEIDNER